jgi:hypothetical protein
MDEFIVVLYILLGVNVWGMIGLLMLTLAEARTETATETLLACLFPLPFILGFFILGEEDAESVQRVREEGREGTNQARAIQRARPEGW